MGKIVTVKVVADTSDAIQDIDQVSDSLKQLDSQSKKATDSQEGLTDQVTKNGGAMALLNTLTGGVAQQFKDAYEASALFTQGLKGMTLAQIRLNVAMAINPLTVAATGVLALGAAIVQYGSSITDGVVSRTETFMNLIKSIGNPLGFAARQAESYAKGLVAIKDAQDELQLDRSIKVLQAFGKSTIDLEIDLAQRKLKALKEGEEGYDEAVTNILVLRARKAKEAGESEAKVYEDAKQAKLKELQLKWQLEQEADEFSKMFQEELGFSEGQAYAEAFQKAKTDEAVINFGLYRDMEDEMFDVEYQAIRDQNQRKIDEELQYNESVAAIRMANIDNVSQGFALLGQLAGKNKELQAAALIGENAAGIARIIVNTQVANAKAVAVSPLTAGQPWVTINKISAGLGIAASIAATARGLSALKAGGVPSRGVSNVGGIGGSTQPSVPNFNVVGQSSANQIADAIAGQQTRPVRAYVVASDVSTAQSLERNIVKGASI